MSSSITNTVKILSHNQYKTPRLIPSSLDASPLVQFSKWLAGALDPVAAGEEEGTPKVHEPEAMTLGTATKEGVPSSRVVLLKGECSKVKRRGGKGRLSSKGREDGAWKGCWKGIDGL